MNQDLNECLLCCESLDIFGIGICNHAVVCYRCTLKSRLKMDNKKCPMCNENLIEIIISDQKRLKYSDFDINDLQIYGNGIFCSSSQVKQQLERITQNNCQIPSCKSSSQFLNIVQLKKHLLDSHSRVMCEICLKSQTALISESKLYTEVGLQKHIKKGDQDEDGNIIFFHPYCKFCDLYLYSEEHLVKHMNDNHFSCHVCGDQQKYRFYKSYKNLETHFKISHYVCQEPLCLEKTFIVFKTKHELELHSTKVHTNAYDKGATKIQKQVMNQYNLQTISGFHFDNQDDKKQKKIQDNMEKIEIKDQEGEDYEFQYLSQRRTKIRAISDKDTHNDEKLDIREFYEYKIHKMPNNEHFFVLDLNPHHQVQQIQNKIILNKQVIKKGKNKRNKNKNGMEEVTYNQVQVQNYEEKKYEDEEEDKDIYFEDANLVFYYNLEQLSKKLFEHKIDCLINEKYTDFFEKNLLDYFKQRINDYDFFMDFVEIFGKKNTFKIFPFFITTISNEITQQELDERYYTELLKLKKRKQSILNLSRSYREFFDIFQMEIEKNFRTRIERKNLDINKKYPQERQRLIQIIEILRRLKTKEMGKFKFLTNFGLSTDMLEKIKHEIIFMDIYHEVQQQFDKFELQELMSLYLYCLLCNFMLQKQFSVNKYRNMMEYDLLYPFLKKNQDLIQNFKKQDEIFEDEEDFSTIQASLQYNQKQRKQSNKFEDFQEEEDAIFDFPDLDKQKQIQQQQQIQLQKIQNNKQKKNFDTKISTTNSWENSRYNQNPFMDNELNKQNLTKKLIEEFPTLNKQTDQKKKNNTILEEQEKIKPLQQQQQQQKDQLQQQQQIQQIDFQQKQQIQKYKKNESSDDEEDQNNKKKKQKKQKIIFNTGFY